MFENVSEIILKVTRDCNLNCQYCYLGDKKQYAGEQMSWQVFKKLIDQVYIDKHLRNKKCFPSNKLQIVFHGGEPTLLGVPKLEKFIKYATKKLPYVTFSMQTNMLLIDQNWVKFFKKYRINPGISIDGNLRKENALRLKNYDFNEKLKLLKKHKIKFGTLMVMSRNNIEKFSKNLEIFVKKYKVSSVKANFVENMARPEFCYPEVTAEQMYDFVFLPVMSIFFNQYKMREANTEHLIDKYIYSLLYKDDLAKTSAHTICHAKFCGGGNTIVEVEPDGQVLFCGRWSNSNRFNLIGVLGGKPDPFGLSTYARVLELQLKKVLALRERKCDSCAAAAICNYGCLAFSYVKYRGRIKIRSELICSFYKKVLSYFSKNLWSIIYIRSLINKNKMLDLGPTILINILPMIGNSLPIKRLPRGLSWQTYEGEEYLAVEKKYLKNFF